ncbi:TerD family protein [Pseudofrankia sp. BMG5.36]|uniref:TerD family protein n=1 Tax=Pseudofrankia sp. BMG5.36 TaxID=1834512 RepID=UPI0009F52C0B|nr:TerD family protein [Pseudofrankia sp. BMG5.36]
MTCDRRSPSSRSWPGGSKRCWLPYHDALCALPTSRHCARGGNVTLSALADELGSVSVMLEWGVELGRRLDADVSAVLVGDDGQARSNDDLVFYNQKAGGDGAVRLRGKVSFTSERFTGFADVIEVDVDDLADSIEKVVLAASMDPATGGVFGQLAFLRLRLMRSSDSTELLRFDIPDATTERAFVFGEIYRRDGKWKFRAVGQGYDGGIDALIADYGLDAATGADVATPGFMSGEAGDSEGDGDDLVIDPPTEQIDIRKIPGADSILATPSTPAPLAGVARGWQQARLFPVAGIGGAQEQERRATSALLAVLAGVDELGDIFRDRMRAPRGGRLTTFTEVSFALNGSAYRPDGVIQVDRPGQRPWTGLVEVKTGKNLLNDRQLTAYLRIARDEGFDGLLTISNQITSVGEGHPLEQSLAAPDDVGLSHLSWAEIRYHCQLLAQHGVADNSQAYILRELLRYLEHPRSGAQIFEDMGRHWVRIRDGVLQGTLRATDKDLPNVLERFDQLTSYLCLHLGGLAGRAVVPLVHAGTDRLRRREYLGDELCRLGSLTASLSLTGVTGPLTLTANLRTSKVTCSFPVEPTPRRPPGAAVDWLLGRLDGASGRLRAEAVYAAAPSGAETSTRAETLSTIRRRPTVLLMAPPDEIRRFVVSASWPLGSKRGRGKDTFITSVVTAVEKFHGAVVTALATATSSSA